MDQDRPRKSRIADAPNTYHHALDIVLKKGYKVFFSPDEREEFEGDYWAIKDGRDFIASDPLRLIGLITIWEEFGDEWYKAGIGSKVMDRIFDVAFPEDEFKELSDDEFHALKEDMEVFFHAVGVEFDKEMNRERLSSLLNKYYKNRE